MEDSTSVAYTFYAAAHGLIVVGTLLGNIGTIAAFWKVPALRDKPSDLLILSLSCADLGVGFVRSLDYPKIVQGYWPFRCNGCKLRALLSDVCVSVGILNTAAICLDRFLLVSRDYPHYLKSQTRTRVLSKIAIMWLYGIAIGVSEIILWPYVKVPKEIDFDFTYKTECRSPVKHNALASLILYIIVIFLPLIVAETLGVLFVCLLKRKLRRPTSIQQHDTDTTTSLARRRNNRFSDDSTSKLNQVGDPKRCYTSSAFVVVVLVLALNLCLLPFALYTLTVSMICAECNNKIVRNLLIDLVYLNSLLNPMLYVLAMEKIRYFCRDLCCRY